MAVRVHREAEAAKRVGARPWVHTMNRGGVASTSQRWRRHPIQPDRAQETPVPGWRKAGQA